MINNKLLNKYNLQKLIFNLIIEMTWHFDVHDLATITAQWPKGESWDALANDIKLVHSFHFTFNDQQFTCIFHSRKRKIYITTDYNFKYKLIELIKTYGLYIDWSLIDEEILNLQSRLQELCTFKEDLIDLMIK